MHQHVQVTLKIPAYQLALYYQGAVDTVAAETTDGRIVHFPANVLRAVVQSHGVYGLFELVFDEHCKFLSISRVAGDSRPG
ncbi:DUF2835 family protein [Nitrosomonas sp. sh817]|uniref:DUF2835 family protein n=1 Tax=Nitrosomonas sp. sh817 TaxID=3070658 RepID=UPI0027DC3A7B|nr:DUF2835 family protein [Nitrosomonas sp. sh817]WMJ08653.1 DUF2835 family protein [Nitrosomonas sp. sh817]